MRFLKTLYREYGYLILLLFLILGLFNPAIAIFALICMMGPILLSFSKGRLWCGYVCPRGNLFDNVIFQFSRGKMVPWILRNIFVRAIIAAGLLYYFASSLINYWGNPDAMGMVFYKMIALTTIIGILLALLFNERAWCRICPMGSISAFISLFKISPYSMKVSGSCVNCKMCAKICPLSIKPYRYQGRTITHPDCIKCNKCVIACPKGAIIHRGFNK